MIHEILTQVDNFKAQISGLKEKSPVYPKIYTEHKGNVFWASTLVHWWHNDILFSRHHVESGVINKNYSEENVVAKLKHDCELTKEKAIPCKYDDVVCLQSQKQKP